MRSVLVTALAAAALAGCGPAPAPAGLPAPEGAPALPPIPERTGPLGIEVAYPAEGQSLTASDSNFIFGQVGTGRATLTINGAAVDVAPNGAFLAFLPVPRDGVYELVATADGQTVSETLTVEVPQPRRPAGTGGALGIVEGTISPAGEMMVVEGEPVDVRFRATPGATARIILPGGKVVPLTERPAREEAQGFMLERTERLADVAEYTGSFAALAIRGAEGATIELIRGGDTIRAPLELALDVVSEHAPRLAVAASSRADRTVIGRGLPGGGLPYHWFFPNGALLTVTGTVGSQHRVRLTEDLSVWVDTAEVDLMPVGTPVPEGSVATVRAAPEPGWIDVRLSTSDPLPFRVDATERALTVTVYGAESRTNWLQYGRVDPLIDRMYWEQPADDQYRLHIELTEPVWGWQEMYDEGGNPVVRVRRPPRIDPANPLRGLHIAIDAGHPPGGAIGPTGYTEAEANLAISRRLVAMLRDRGATVLETRPDTATVGLGDRPIMATEADADILISVHNNAFPDGVNPWENNGTSVFYNQPQSVGLARALQVELLRELGLRDLGIGRADLALVRPTWMPSALTETMFLMIPEQEAALQNPSVQERIARAHVRALEAWLRR